MARGELFILSAPSGTGKTTLIRELMNGPLKGLGGVRFSVSHTTRAARPGEVDGRDYHFVERPEFEAMAATGAFLEWAVYDDNLYGTSEQPVMSALAAGVDVILDIEVQGAEQVLRRLPEAQGIFVLPPSREVLERRLRERGQDESRSIARRLDVSLSEIECYERYRYVIINDDLKRASLGLAAIILEKRHRLERQRQGIQDLLREFRASPGVG